jgi:type II secretory pathway pseudopilin PulG
MLELLIGLGDFMPTIGLKMHKSAGFSLVQMSTILIVAGIVVAATLPGKEMGSTAEKTRITTERMRKIEAAMQGYMAQYHRRPQPADLTQPITSSSYGQQLSIPEHITTTFTPDSYFTKYLTIMASSSTNTFTASPSITDHVHPGWLVSGTNIPNDTEITNISGSTITLSNPINVSGTPIFIRNPIVAGGVPTRVLGLPDEMAIDGFGRRIMYVVDERATVQRRCQALQNSGQKGAIIISNSDDFDADNSEHVMWALLSYGQDGQGAVSAQGSALSSRIKTGNTESAVLNNSFYDNSETTVGPSDGLIKQDPSSTFDDIVWYDPAYKNTCCMGECKKGITVGL